MKILCTLDLTTSIEGEHSTEKKLVQVVADNRLHAISKVKKHYASLNEALMLAQNPMRYSADNIQELETIE